MTTILASNPFVSFPTIETNPRWRSISANFDVEMERRAKPSRNKASLIMVFFSCIASLYVAGRYLSAPPPPFFPSLAIDMEMGFFDSVLVFFFFIYICWGFGLLDLAADCGKMRRTGRFCQSLCGRILARFGVCFC